MDLEREELDYIAQIIFDNNGVNIFALDLRDTTAITDYMMITEGTSDRHVKSLAKKVIEAVEKIGGSAFLVEGMQDGDWVVVDFVTIVVHFFTPEIREKYKLEELWSDGQIVDLKIKLPKERGL